jgi:hypothetical protein
MSCYNICNLFNDSVSSFHFYFYALHIVTVCIVDIILLLVNTDQLQQRQNMSWTDMAKRKRTNGQTTIYKILHENLKTE